MFKELLRHTRHSLDPLFAPASVAVIGASATPGKVGHQVMKNLIGAGFSGVVYPVNPTHKAVLGIHCFANLQDIPEPIELALVSTAAHRGCDAFQQYIAAGEDVGVTLSHALSPLRDTR